MNTSFYDLIGYRILVWKEATTKEDPRETALPCSKSQAKYMLYWILEEKVISLHNQEYSYVFVVHATFGMNKSNFLTICILLLYEGQGARFNNITSKYI